MAGKFFYTNWLYYIIFILCIISIHKEEYENDNNESEGQIQYEWYIVKALKVRGKWHILCPQLTVKWDEHHDYHRKYYSRFTIYAFQCSFWTFCVLHNFTEPSTILHYNGLYYKYTNLLTGPVWPVEPSELPTAPNSIPHKH